MRLLLKPLGLCLTVSISTDSLLVHGQVVSHRYILLGLQWIKTKFFWDSLHLKTWRFCLKVLISNYSINQKIWQYWQEGGGCEEWLPVWAIHALSISLPDFTHKAYLPHPWKHLNCWQAALTILTTGPKQRMTAIIYRVLTMGFSELFSYMTSLNPPPTPRGVPCHSPQITEGETEAREVQWFAGGHTAVSGRNPRKAKDGWLWNHSTWLLIYPAFKTGQIRYLFRTFPIS